MRHQIMNPHAPPLFRWAIFSSSSLPWVGNHEDGVEVTPIMEWRKQVPVELADIEALCAELATTALPPPCELGVEGVAPCLRRQAQRLADQPMSYQKIRTRRMHPEVDKVRLSIPTGHAISKNDFAYVGSQMLRQLCDSRLMSTMEHSAGHAIPRNVLEARKFRDLIERTQAKANLAI